MFELIDKLLDWVVDRQPLPDIQEKNIYDWIGSIYVGFFVLPVSITISNIANNSIKYHDSMSELFAILAVLFILLAVFILCTWIIGVIVRHWNYYKQQPAGYLILFLSVLIVTATFVMGAAIPIEWKTAYTEAHLLDPMFFWGSLVTCSISLLVITIIVAPQIETSTVATVLSMTISICFISYSQIVPFLYPENGFLKDLFKNIVHYLS